LRLEGIRVMRGYDLVDTSLCNNVSLHDKQHRRFESL